MLVQDLSPFYYLELWTKHYGMVLVETLLYTYPSYILVIKYLLWDLDVAILEHFRFSDIETSISIDIQQRGYKCFISMTDH